MVGPQEIVTEALRSSPLPEIGPAACLSGGPGPLPPEAALSLHLPRTLESSWQEREWRARRK